MKKKLFIAIITIMASIFAAGCNMQMIDTTYKYDRAIISLPNGEVIDGKVDSWLDFENSDQIQVKIDGTSYLVHSEDIALISN